MTGMDFGVEDGEKSNMTESVRFRVTAKLRNRWDQVLSDRRLSQQDAANALFAWLVDQDPLTQAMIFGQVPDTDHAELSRIVLRRLAATGGPQKGRAKREG